MSIRRYIEIVSHHDNRVSFAAPELKPQGTSALSTLNRIESMMRQRVQGTEGVTQEVLWRELKEKAESIKVRYLAKTGEMGSLRRWLFSIPRKEQAIRIA